MQRSTKNISNYQLSDGRLVTIRPITSNDVFERHEFFVQASLYQQGMVHTVQETELHTDETKTHILNFLHHGRGIWLIALIEDAVIAEIDITVKNLMRIRHNGTLTMAVLPQFHRLGLGSLLLSHALEWAREAYVQRIELSVFKTNIAAQKLYEKFGFYIIGTRHGFLRHADGNWEDDIIMERVFDER